MLSSRTRTGLFFLLLLLISASSMAADITLQNDGFTSGASVGFQAGFTSGEMGASRFTPPGTVQLKEVQFLFGGSPAQETVTLRVWDDSALGANPGTEFYSGDYLLTPSDTAFQVLDLTGESIFVSNTFRVGIEFQHSGLPSIARDDDGNINATLNYLFASGIGWAQSDFFGLTGDWIIRTVVTTVTANYTVGGTVSGLEGTLVLQNNGGDDLVINADGSFTFATPVPDGDDYAVTVLSAPATQNCIVSMGSGTISAANVTDVMVNCTDKPGDLEVLQYDSFVTGQSVGFQGGFVANEIAAVRFVPSGPVRLEVVQFLFGGAAGSASIRLHVWDDSAGTNDPGVELFAQDYLVTASDADLQEIDVGSQGIQLNAPFRVGIELLASGLPSVARDDDGNINAAVNFILASGIGWVPSSTLGLTGDWILRAVVSASGMEPVMLSVEDVGNDQGRQVRLRFEASSQDAPGAAQPVLRYEAFRRIDTLPSGIVSSSSDKRLDGWEFVGEIPAHGESIYNMVVPTLADSTVSQGMHWSVFFVRAATDLPTVFHDAAPDSGWSLDNLAPSAPDNLILAGTQLSWDPAGEDDFDYHAIYGSTTGMLDGTQSLLGYTATNSFGVGVSPSPYYLVTSVDFAGNEGDAAMVQDLVTAADSVPGRRFWARVSPNPFNPATSVRFSLPEAGEVSIWVYDLRGRKVDTLLERRSMSAGEHQLPYRSKLASGVYLLKVVSGAQAQTVKVSLVR